MVIFFDNGMIQVYDYEHTHGLVAIDYLSENLALLSFHDLEQIYLNAKVFYEKDETE